MIIRREEYERLITDVRIYEETLQIISVEPGILNVIAEKMRRLAQHALKKYH